MHRPSVLAVVALTSISTAIGFNLPLCDNECKFKAFGHLFGSCHRPFPQTCLPAIHSQALSFCSTFLSLTTTATTTGFTTITITETDVVSSTVLETSTTTTSTTSTEIDTSTAISLSTVTSTSLVPPPVVTVTFKRRAGDGPGCPDLSTKTAFLSRLPATKVSSICSRLGVTATTVASTETFSSTAISSATTTSTEITTSTDIEVETSITILTSTTVTTSAAVSTTIVEVNYCDPSQVGMLPNSNTGAGNVILTPGGISSANECCRKCWATLDCVASSYPNSGQCQLLVKSNPATGGAVTPRCPLGKAEDVVFLVGGGNVFRGPCL